jgi:hypothetical protein
VVELPVSRLRQSWPEVRIAVRADPGFCRQRLLRWCGRANAGYAIGVARETRCIRLHP